MNKLFRVSILLIVFVFVIGLLAGCGGDDKKDDEGGTKEKTSVSIQLAWVATAEYAGFYVAQENGYYADENLEVDVRSGGFDEEGNFIFSVTHVANGDADFGLIGGDQLLTARANGTPIVAIGVVFQRSPVVLISLAEKDITTPQDLIGKSIAIDLESATGLSFISLLNSQDIGLDQVTIVPRTDFTNTVLTDGTVDVLDGFITNQPIQLRNEGYDINLILASDYGVDLYTNVIYTTEDMIANHPDIVEGFLRATLKGYREAINNTQKATDIVLAVNDTLGSENELESLQASLPLLDPAGSEIGMMTGEAWEYMHGLLLEEGILSEPLDVSKAYTLDFLNAIYEKESQ